MTDSGVIALPLPDAPARARIATDLDTNLLVEAGAGSGKTTALVGRMVALVTTGSAKVDQIAAVTFTRKAAGELRERFQTAIELRIREERDPDDPDELVLDRLTHALDEIDRAFIGTIHSFCGRLLRERPLEVGLDPGFQELPVEERAGLRRRFWASYLERLARDCDPLLEELVKAGLRPTNLTRLFDHLVENPDVDFPADAIEPPSMSDVGAIRDELDEIVDRGWELMDDRPPGGAEWDSLQKKIRRLHFERDITGWQEASDLFDAVALLCKSGTRGHSVTLKRWRDRAMAKALKERVNAFGVGDTPAQRLVGRWYAHRYALAIRLGGHAVEEFSAHRLRIGKLDFQDLLVLAARLLKSDPDVRRQLGGRYQRLLVDEFQDTDPLQAEIMLLLSSSPTEGRGPATAEASASSEADADWRLAVPRPGALFVVGDPKQSIYRFRRADIQLYGFVKERFAEFGAVVALSTNFRSRPPIGDLVNALFPQPGFFPEEATAEQAAFERLDIRPPSHTVPREGVFTYDIAPEATNKAAAAADDAGRMATWIRDRVDTGERCANDFLILTRGRGELSAYARALEAHSLPVQVTGAGIGVAEELRELQVLLECMIDPTNPVKVLSALVGLFFGIDYERLVAHRLDGGSFDAMRPGDRGQPDVISGLQLLHSWWRASASDPADVFVSRLVSELGLLPYAASGDLGTLRAGALLYALDAVRATALAGDASLPGALAALQAALDLKEAEAPLEPGRPDAVRLMNLHQAKGLEATVVILANPTEIKGHRPDIHLSRSETGLAEGFLRVTPASSGWATTGDLARPIGWADKEEAEQDFAEAEEVRLLYVAATRAREELVVARWPGGRGTSPWAALDSWLDEHAEHLTLEARDAAEKEEVGITPEEAEAAVASAAASLASMGVPSYRQSSVTELTKNQDERSLPTSTTRDGVVDRGELRGFSWGSVVHGALAAAAGNPNEGVLHTACRDLLVEYERPLDDHGEPKEIGELIGLVQTVRASDLWARAQAAERILVEVPFSAPGVHTHNMPPDSEPQRAEPPSKGKRQLDLFSHTGPSASDVTSETGAGAAVDAGARAGGDAESKWGEAGEYDDGPGLEVLEGVIDLAFREPDGWVIADYKTDVGTDPDFLTRKEAYRRQVDLYSKAWTTLTGEPVKERVLFFTAQGRVENW